jgi:hypothetical protein
MEAIKLMLLPVCLFFTFVSGCDISNTPPDPGPQEIIHTLTNSDFETGDLTGWAITGIVAMRTTDPLPYQGTYYIYGSNTPDFTLSQEVDLIDAGVVAGDIDSGLVDFQVDGYRASWASSPPQDEGEFTLRFKDDNKNEISVMSSGLEAIDPGKTWVYRSFQTAVPATTRYVDVILHGSREAAGNNCDGYFDQISARSIVH